MAKDIIGYKFPRVVIVTSLVTYVPDNYFAFLGGLLRSSYPNLAAVFVVNNRTPDLFKKSTLLALAGARNFARCLLANYIKTSPGVRSANKDTRRNLCESFDIPYHLINDINSAEALELMHSYQPDLIVNARTRSYFKKEILALPKLAAINIHHGLLPHFRGTFCDLQAIGQGKNPGFSIHRMTDKIDQGEIFLTEENANPSLSYLEYIQASSVREAAALKRLMTEIAQTGSLPPGRNNQQSEQTCFYKTPNLTQIKQFKQKGIQL